MSRDLDAILDDAAEEMRTWAKENPDDTEPHDFIHETADSGVPVYHSDLLKLAAENHSLALDEPELGPAYDGKPTPINIIAANVYEAIEARMWDEWRSIESEREEAESEATA